MRLPMVFAIGLIVIAGCMSARPVLYPNEQARRVGGVAADRDVDDCIRQAEASRSAIHASPMGSAGTSEMGAMPTNPASAISGLFGKPELSEGQKVFVNKCLRDKGYDPVAWN